LSFPALSRVDADRTGDVARRIVLIEVAANATRGKRLTSATPSSS